MRAALGSPAPSPAAPEAAAPRTEAAGSATLAAGLLFFLFFLALVPLALYARILFFSPLEVSDESLAAGVLDALRSRGLGGLLLHLLGAGTGEETVPVLARLLSLALHAGATLALFGLARRLGASRAMGGVAGLAFAVSPLSAQSVAWLSQLDVLLGGALFLLGAW